MITAITINIERVSLFVVTFFQKDPNTERIKECLNKEEVAGRAGYEAVAAVSITPWAG
jgi:hypothetical protein